MTKWSRLARKALADIDLTREEAMSIATSTDEEILEVMQAAFQVRYARQGRRVRIHVLNNAKSGRCAEDCSFCSQSVHANSDIPEYPMQTVEQLLEGAAEAVRAGATTYCMVTAARGPSANQLQTVMDATVQIKEKWNIKVCASLGLLEDGQADQLAAAGVDRYNHNLETSRRHFPSVVSTHSFDDRVTTIQTARRAGMEACAGGLIGMGEDPEDWVDMALSLRELRVESLPLNFLNPRPGTRESHQERLKPLDCLRGLALFRLTNPQAEDIRIAGGREECLGSLQPLALYAASSLFIDGYLTTGGQGASQDRQMILDAGFYPEVLSADSLSNTA